MNFIIFFHQLFESLDKINVIPFFLSFFVAHNIVTCHCSGCSVSCYKCYHYTFEKRYYVFTTHSVCLSVCLSVCVSVCLCVCVSVIRIVTRWLHTATRYYVRLLALTTAQHCNIIKMIRWWILNIWIIHTKSHFGL